MNVRKDEFVEKYLLWVRGMLNRHLEPESNELSYIAHASKIIVGHIKTVDELIKEDT